MKPAEDTKSGGMVEYLFLSAYLTYLTLPHLAEVLSHGLECPSPGRGAAKTTTVAALGVLLSRTGTRVHLLHMDPQASLTHAFGVSDNTDGLQRPHRPGGFPVESVFQNLSLTPSTIELARAES